MIDFNDNILFRFICRWHILSECKTADLVTFTEEILFGKLYFLCSDVPIYLDISKILQYCCTIHKNIEVGDKTGFKRFIKGSYLS